MSDIEIPELNKKIGQLIEGLGFTSSKFADFIAVSRPIISHIIAGRNKPSLDIIQSILFKFPALGIHWTYDGTELDKGLLLKIANTRVENSFSTSSEQKVSVKETISGLHELPNSRTTTDLNKLTKIVVLREGETFEEYLSVTSKSQSKQISKIVVFFADNSFIDYNPA
ncbi:MAG: transcriptional regulator with XRE-family HTH domain [Algoriphagus sp.]|jgi:transcriptional regulator with XRE-family HTH domain